jgi:hypothetical protein
MTADTSLALAATARTGMDRIPDMVLDTCPERSA